MTMYNIVIVNGGTSDPSSTAMLARKAAASTAEIIGADKVSVRTLELKPLAVDIAHALTTGLLSTDIDKATEMLGDADAIVASTPIYKAGASALFSGFFQVLDQDLLIGKPVVLAATAGSARHSLVVDQEIRSLFSYLRTITTPTSLFSTPEDWGSNELGKRIDRAAAELALLVKSNFAKDIRTEVWGEYQHSFGSAGGTETTIDLNSDLMRLATGG